MGKNQPDASVEVNWEVAHDADFRKPDGGVGSVRVTRSETDLISRAAESLGLTSLEFSHQAALLVANDPLLCQRLRHASLPDKEPNSSPILGGRMLSESQTADVKREQNRRYITSAERIGREDGRQAGLREGRFQGIELCLGIKFGPASQELVPKIRQLTDLAAIRAVYAEIAAAQSLDDLRRIYNQG